MKSSSSSAEVCESVSNHWVISTSGRKAAAVLMLALNAEKNKSQVIVTSHDCFDQCSKGINLAKTDNLQEIDILEIFS